MDAPPAVPMNKLVPFHGTWMVQRIVNVFPQIEKFQAQPDDVLIATFPKAVPKLLDAMPSPRLIKTHLAPHLIPESFWKNNCKIIYMARNAKDVAVSLFFFLQSFKSYESTSNWDQFLELFMAGEVFYGSWYDHVLGWWAKRDNPNVLYLFYEDMKENPMQEIRKITQFLEMELSEEALKKVVHHTTFKAMKENTKVNYLPIPNEKVDQRISPFMRKGEVGDWKNHFTVAQNESFNEHFAKKMAGTSLHFQSEI